MKIIANHRITILVLSNVMYKSDIHNIFDILQFRALDMMTKPQLALREN